MTEAIQSLQEKHDVTEAQYTMEPRLQGELWWIASYPKSGNSWIRLFFDAYLNGPGWGLNDGSLDIMDDRNKEIIEMAAPVPATRLSMPHWQMAQQAAFLHLLYITDRPHLYIKTHSAHGFVNSIPLIPDSITGRALIVIRDPRDLCVSFAKHMSISIDDMIMLLNHGQWSNGSPKNGYHHTGTWSDFHASWLSPKPYPILPIKFEHLKTNPDKHFRTILEFFDHPIDEERLAFAIDQTNIQNLRKMEEKVPFVEHQDVHGGHFFRKGQVGEYKEVLTSAQISKIEEDHREIMTHMGYL